MNFPARDARNRLVLSVLLGCAGAVAQLTFGPAAKADTTPAATLIQLIQRNGATAAQLHAMSAVPSNAVTLTDSNALLRDDDIQAVNRVTQQHTLETQTLQNVLATMQLSCPAGGECFCFSPPCPSTIGDLLTSANVPVNDIVTASVVNGIVDLDYLIPPTAAYDIYGHAVSCNARPGEPCTHLIGAGFTPFSLVGVACSAGASSFGFKVRADGSGRISAGADPYGYIDRFGGTLLIFDPGRPTISLTC